MKNFLIRHKESLLVALLGLVIVVALNIMMLQYHYQPWTNPKVGFWSAFWNRWEVSGFDPYTYIVVSKWRPLYVLSRHPLLAGMMWPLSELNSWLMEETGVNCAIFIVGVLLVLLSLSAWMLMYRIQRRLLEMSAWMSLLLTLFFYSFSHVMLTIFVEDHMAMTLPLLLLSVYLAGKAIKRGKTMPLWQSLPLLFVSTGVTTTNCVKIGLSDIFTQWGRKSFGRIVVHFLVYLIPMSVIAGFYFYQEHTTQIEEKHNIERTVNKRMQRDSVFAVKWKKELADNERRKHEQLVQLSFVTNTDYKIDRLPSLVENVFGEGFILHNRYPLRDSNKNHRPVLVRYKYWWNYLLEGMIVVLFITGVFCGRKERLMWMVMSMFLFDMFLHVGLNFASADVYIMTAHWAFVIPVAVAYLIKKTMVSPKLNIAVVAAVIFLTLYMWVHNLQIIIPHIIR
ncbi:MAG: DUF6080 domain-containing protein [Prevotellaceae bacterium]|nr:DUF6080 domain-containing protein [Prevotellaceae bacterium]